MNPFGTGSVGEQLRARARAHTVGTDQHRAFETAVIFGRDGDVVTVV